MSAGRVHHTPRYHTIRAHLRNCATLLERDRDGAYHELTVALNQLAESHEEATQ